MGGVWGSFALECASGQRQQVHFSGGGAGPPRNGAHVVIGIETDIDYFMGDKPKKQKM